MVTGKGGGHNMNPGNGINISGVCTLAGFRIVCSAQDSKFNPVLESFHLK